MITVVGLLFGSVKEDLAKEIQKATKKIANKKSTNTNNDFILKTYIRTFKQIPEETDQYVKGVKVGIRKTIFKTIRKIESNKAIYKGTLLIDEEGNIKYLEGQGLSAEEKMNQKTKAQLLEGNFKNSVSIRSAAIAFEVLSKMNKELISRAQSASDKKSKQNLYINQAIFVYEMSDIVLQLLSSIELEGSVAIQNVYKDIEKDVQSAIEAIELAETNAQKDYKDGVITKEKLDRKVKQYKLSKQHNEDVLKKWNEGVLVKLKNQEEFLNSIKQKKRLIQSKMEDAKIQLQTLQNIRNLDIIQESLISLDDLVNSVSDLELLVLDEATVNSLLETNVDK